MQFLLHTTPMKISELFFNLSALSVHVSLPSLAQATSEPLKLSGDVFVNEMYRSGSLKSS